MVASPEAATNETTINNDNPEDTTYTQIESELKALGWDTHFANQLLTERNDDEAPPLFPVRITEVRGKDIHVMGPGGLDQLIPVTQGQKIINTNNDKVVVAGDWILVEQDNQDLRIKQVLNRYSVIKRKAPGRNVRRKQLIASNLNTVFVVSSCNQDFNIARLERYIAMVLETENVEPVVVLTKKDLLETMGDMDMEDFDEDEDDDEDDMEDFDFNEDDENGSSWLLDYYLGEAESIASGRIPVVCLDARNSTQASDLLQPWLGEGQTVAFVGSSGVGKSTLVNSLCGFELVKTGQIHTDSGQGRHTTTRRQLHFLTNNDEKCAILDTPGLRELQLVDASNGLEEVFKDLVEVSWNCKFNDCTHSGEPGCAVMAAVEEGDVDEDKVNRWKKLVAEDLSNTKDVDESRIERERKKNRKKKSKNSIQRKDDDNYR